MDDQKPIELTVENARELGKDLLRAADEYEDHRTTYGVHVRVGHDSLFNFFEVTSSREDNDG
jgi:hypothetical protein